MSKTKKICLCLSFSVIVAFLLTIAIATLNLKSKKVVVMAEETGVLAETEIAPNYPLGGEFVVPSANILYKGDSYEATSHVFYTPDGVAHKAKKYVLDALGQYTVEYRVIIGEITPIMLKATQVFNVNNSRISTSSNLSTITYGEFASSKDLADNKKEGIILEGITLNLVEGDTFTFNEPIKLNAVDKNSLIKFRLPQSLNDLEAGMIYVTLTDCYDSSNFIKISLNSSVSNSIYYLATSVMGSSYIGLVPGSVSNRETIWLDGIKYIVYEDYNGASLTGAADKWCTTEYLFDASTNEIYANRLNNQNNIIVSDLDNSNLYSKIFENFTNNECYLSITAGDYRKSAVSIEIEEIAGIPSSELYNAVYKDEESPSIYIDTQLDISTPLIIAKGDKIDVFEAHSYDVNSVENVKKTVYYNYGLSSQTVVGISGGKFEANKEGEYTIVYKVEDSFGNISIKTMKAIALTLRNNKTVNCEIEPQGVPTMEAGMRVKLPSYTLESYNAGEFMNICAIYENGKIVAVDKETLEFLPVYIGKCKVVYSYGDYVQQGETIYEYDIVVSNNVAFLEELKLDKFYIKDAHYSLPQVYVNSFEKQDEEKILADAYLRFDEQTEYTKVDANDVVINGNETVQFKFEYQDAVIESEKIEIIDVGFGDGKVYPEKYFNGNMYTETTTDGMPKNENNRYLNSIRLKTNEILAETGSAKVEYILPVSISSLKISFRFIQDFANFSELKFTLTDYYDSNNKVAISYTNAVEGINVNIAETANTVLNYRFNGEEAYNTLTSITYKMRGKRFIESSGQGSDVTYDCKFKSDKCYLTIELLGVVGNAGVQIENICEQAFYGSLNRDDVAPIVTIDGIGGLYTKDTLVEIPVCEFLDVMSPVLNSNVTLSVTDPNGVAVKDINDVTLNKVSANKAYKIRLTEFGSYVAFYKITDSFGNLATKRILLQVEDSEAPVVVLRGVAIGEEVAATKGDTISLAEYSISDNSDSVEEIVITRVVFDSNSAIIGINQDSFVARDSGIYTVVYYAMDKTGNYTCISYNIRVN